MVNEPLEALSLPDCGHHKRGISHWATARHIPSRLAFLLVGMMTVLLLSGRWSPHNTLPRTSSDHTS